MTLLGDGEIRKRNGLFSILAGTDKSQIASMVLQPGQPSGDYGNEHAGSDQILYVIEGQATALVEGQEFQLGPNDVILIEAGEQHQIKNSGQVPLRTLNVYSPPGY